ncbi:hypothetical protein HK096_008653, partial [Nowakowskiella sp. JEL0078]
MARRFTRTLLGVSPACLPHSFSRSFIAPAPLSARASATLSKQSPAASLLSNNAFAVQRQIEMLNVFLGFEQANKYRIVDELGTNVGFIAEEDSKISNSILRQLLRTRRAFGATVLDAQGAV